jgi:cytoskeletal protein CcmA (bactofilin family)
MFSKPARTAASHAEPADAQGRKPLAASLIAENVTLDGDLVTDGDVQLDGRVRGDLRVGRLTIGETGRVEGSIEADAVEIRGRVTGSVTAAKVRLYATAQVEGDITQDQLAIEAGARFAGRSLRLETAVASEPLSLVHAAAV